MQTNVPDRAGAAPAFGLSPENLSKKIKVFPAGADDSAMRLLSFLSDIEKTVVAESPDIDGGAWETSRMVNFHQGLARLTLTPRIGNDFPGGAIFIQAFKLADGSQSLKASLNWDSNQAFTVVSVYSTPRSNWKLEASRIASGWLEGPREVAAPAPMLEERTPLAAYAS